MAQRPPSPDADVFGDDLDEVLGRANPNPDRLGCPPRDTLVELARRTRPMDDPAYQHLLKCSPCYVEVRRLQVAAGASTQPRTGRPTAWLALAAALILAVVGTLLYRQSRQVSPAEPASPAVVQNVPSPTLPTAPVATPVPLQADLRKFTVFRSAEGNGNARDVVSLQPALLDLTLMLPAGSEPGDYEVQLLDSQLKSLASGRGEGALENYITTVRVTLDLRPVPRGAHQLAVRRGDDQWRFFAARVE